MTTVPRSPACGHICVHHPGQGYPGGSIGTAVSGQYPGAPGAPPPINYGSGALPFTGAGDLLPSLLGLALLCAVLYVLARLNCWWQGGSW